MVRQAQGEREIEDEAKTKRAWGRYPDTWFSIHFIDRILEMEDMALPSRESLTLYDIIEKG